ncbi:MAG: hypothetical protein MMC23_002525 [Stictis urceolatum]|nr:hypothetical protein [Stictis urceolata]
MDPASPPADMADTPPSTTAAQTFASSLSRYTHQPASPLKRKPSPSSPAPTSKRQTRLSFASSSILKTTTPNPTPPSIPPSTRSPPIKNNLTDSLAPHLLLLFIGVNPGLLTASTGHAYAHPSNLYWKLMHASGLTNRRLAPAEDHDLPRLYQYGHTNIVARPTRDASMLGNGELDAGVEVLEEKCRRWRPEAVVLVGKGIWEAVFRVWRGRGLGRGEFGYGWQRERMGRVRGKGKGEGKGEEGWEGARIFVATTTSGLAAGMSWEEKLDVWKELAGWVGERRRARVREGGEVGEEVDVEKLRGEDWEGNEIEGGKEEKKGEEKEEVKDEEREGGNEEEEE